MEQEPKSIVEILRPHKGWLPYLAKACKSSRGFISLVVNDEKTESSHWPKVEELARLVDNEAYEARMNFINTPTAA